MTVTINPEYIYLTITLVLMSIQLLQWRLIFKLRREVKELWDQISIMVISSAGIFEKFQKKIDEKQDK